MKKTTALLMLVLSSISVFSRTLIVDINGGGQFTSIQSAINNAIANDTIKVWPGAYNEQLTLNKNVVLMGSGYENTILTGNFNPTVNISTGKLMWFMISSTLGNGIKISGGIVSNNVIIGCPSSGIISDLGGGSIINCTILKNGAFGIEAQNGSTAVVNCISRNNGNYGFYSCRNGGQHILLSYSDGSSGCTLGNQGCMDVEPQFISTADFHISQGSPCWDAGNPSLSDPDGSISDMGYFGGPDCPIYPVVYEIKLLSYGSNITIEAKARANY